MIQLNRTFEEAMGSGALRQLATRLDEGSRVVTVSGTAGGAKALTIAKAILAENRSAAVIAPTNAEALNLGQELRFYVNLLSRDPIEITHLPALEVDPYRGLSPHPEIAAARARAIWQLLQDKPRVLIASIQSAAVRMHGP
ncbi:MAG: transcription-repair coupling factor, partial [Acidobacteria bacterium]|nr:transcription-repair coupling factor [Acidobacteriota bacterium]